MLRKTSVARSLLVCGSLLMLGLALQPVVGPAWGEPATTSGPSLIQQLEQAYMAIAEEVRPSVVVIEVKLRTTPVSERLPFNPEDLPPEMRRFFRFEFPLPPAPRGRGDGSGFVVDPSGWVVTNSHVIQDADPNDIVVRLAEGKEFTAQEVHTDPMSDIAVVRIDPGGIPLHPIAVGDSDGVRVGQIAVAVGNPFGIGVTFNVGVISALGGEINSPARDDRGVPVRSIAGLIQTDASVNPGNSGGPLCNINGEVIGVNTAIVSRSGGNEGVAFAIPVTRARRIWETLIAKGRIQRGWLGVELQREVPPQALAALGSPNGGAYVSRALPDSPAAKAGVCDGDLIIALRPHPETTGQEIVLRSSQDLIDAVDRLGPDVDVELTILRQGARQTVRVSLGEFPENLSRGQSRVTTAATNPLGLSAGELSADQAEKMGLGSPDGVAVTTVDPDGAAANEGIREGDIIVQIGDRFIHNVQDYEKAVDSLAGSSGVLIVVKRAVEDRTSTVPIYVPLKP